MTEHDYRPLSDNYYDILGVARTASVDEITDAEIALRKLYEARSKQGDRNATDILRRLNEANSELTVDYRRAEYDRRPETIANGFADAAYSPQIGRFQKLVEVGSWFADADPVRDATLIGQQPPADLLRLSSLLGDDASSTGQHR